MLLLDTEDVPADQRAEAFRDTLGGPPIPLSVNPLPSGGRFRARVEVWQYGGAALLAVDSSGYRLERTPRHVRMESPAAVSVLFKPRGRGLFTQFGRDHVLGPDTMALADLTTPYSCSSAGTGRSRIFRMPYDQIGLPVDLVRRAGAALPASPLYALVHRHLRDLAERAEEISGDAGAAAFGTATTDLVRALITSAVGDERFDRPAMAETLMTRVRAYVGLHLTDPELSAEVIARTHHVSVRQLYKTCAAAGLSLEQWIIDQRLEYARTVLASPTGRHRSIAATALACGFAGPSHFSRRFRDAFGMSPRDWQQTARSGAA
jgi:AraC-like DNA-binding protein